MQVQSVFQPQTAYAREMFAAAAIAGDGSRRDGKVPPASFSVDIGEAARAMLVGGGHNGASLHAQTEAKLAYLERQLAKKAG